MFVKVGDKVRELVTDRVGHVSMVNFEGSRAVVDFPGLAAGELFDSTLLELVPVEQVLGAMSGVARRHKPMVMNEYNSAPDAALTKAQDLLTVDERSSLEDWRNTFARPSRIIIEALDRLAPKPVEAPKPVSGWEACEDMRKRPEARYTLASADVYCFDNGLLKVKTPYSNAFIESRLAIHWINDLDWVKRA